MWMHNYFTIEALCRRSVFCWAWSICEKMLEPGSLARSFHSVGRIKPWALEMFDEFSNAAWKDCVSAVVRGSFRMMRDVRGGETVFNSVVNGISPVIRFVDIVNLNGFWGSIQREMLQTRNLFCLKGKMKEEGLHLDGITGDLIRAVKEMRRGAGFWKNVTICMIGWGSLYMSTTSQPHTTFFLNF